MERDETPQPASLPDPAPASEAPAMMECTPLEGLHPTQYPPAEDA